jgi:hypothetical protein
MLSAGSGLLLQGVLTPIARDLRDYIVGVMRLIPAIIVLGMVLPLICNLKPVQTKEIYQ